MRNSAYLKTQEVFECSWRQLPEPTAEWCCMKNTIVTGRYVRVHEHRTGNGSWKKYLGLHDKTAIDVKGTWWSIICGNYCLVRRAEKKEIACSAITQWCFERPGKYLHHDLALHMELYEQNQSAEE